jgi:hypothetical protein
MFEKRRSPKRILLSCLLIAFMVASGIPAGILGASQESSPAGPEPRVVTDTAADLFIPEGESYELFGLHSYSRSITINGTLNITAYNGVDNKTGTLTLKSRTITIGPNGNINGDGRGYGGGGGGTSQASTTAPGGKGGVLGMGGNGAAPMTGLTSGGGGGGSNGGLGGTGSYPGLPGTSAKGGDGGPYSSYIPGKGGIGYGAGGGGGFSGSTNGGGGGGGGGTGGMDAAEKSGALGGGPFPGTGGTFSTSGYTVLMDAKNGGYLFCETNGDVSLDLNVYRGSGGGGGAGAALNTGGGGGGGAGGAAISITADGNLVVAGTITSLGGGGGTGGYYSTGSTATYVGGMGGGGAGGGILLGGLKLVMAGTLDNRGRIGKNLSIINGGTVKLFYSDLFMPGTVYKGMMFSNARPKIKDLLEPVSGTETVIRPTFKWDQVEDPEGDTVVYQVQVSTTSDFASIRHDQAGIADDEYRPTTPLLGKEFFWRVRAWDPYGPGPWSEPWQILVDNSPPTSVMDALPEYSTIDTFNLSWKGSDNTGVWYYMVYYSDNAGDYQLWVQTLNTSCEFTGLEGHMYWFYTLAADISENVEIPPVVPDAQTSIDSSPPDTWFVSPAPYQTRPIFQVGWNGTDPTSGISGYSIYVSDNGAPFHLWLDNTPQTAALYRGQENHEYAFYIIARDTAGNVQPAPKPQDIWKTRVDASAPVTTFLPTKPFFGGDPIYITPETNISLGATSDYAGLMITRYILDENETLNFTGPFNESDPGLHNITVWSIDKAGNQEKPHTIRFWVDVETPRSSIAFIGLNATREGIFYVSADTQIFVESSDEASGVNRTVMTVDGVPMEYSTPFKLARGGIHTVIYYAVDNVGHREEERTETVIVDIWPPSTLPEGPTGMQKKAVKMVFKGTDLESGYEQSFYRVTAKGDTSMAFTAGGEVILPAKDDHSSDGTYTIDYYSVDKVGNAEAFRSVEVTIDTLASMTLDLKPSVTVDQNSLVVKGTAEPGANILINGRYVLVKSDGSFSYPMELGRGKNKIVVSMTDAAGNAVSETHVVTYTPSDELPAWYIPLVVVTILALGTAVSMMVFMRMRRMREQRI